MAYGNPSKKKKGKEVNKVQRPPKLGGMAGKAQDSIRKRKKYLESI